MIWWHWAVILFVVGVVEHVLSEYENLLSVRLKVGQTVLFSEVNRLLDGVVYLITFNLFWKGLEHGQVAFSAFVPYLFYIQGCVLGTALALLHYRRHKKTSAKKQRLIHLEKARSIKKQIQTLEDDLKIEMEVETEAEFQAELEKESKDATSKEIHPKADSDRKSTKEERDIQNPPQPT